MSSSPLDSVQTVTPHADDRRHADAAFSGYDYRGFRLALMDVISAWAISGVIIALAFAFFG